MVVLALKDAKLFHRRRRVLYSFAIDYGDISRCVHHSVFHRAARELFSQHIARRAVVKLAGAVELSNYLRVAKLFPTTTVA